MCDLTGYASFQGSVLQGAELSSLLQGLESNNLIGGYSHMLTVYICMFCARTYDKTPVEVFVARDVCLFFLSCVFYEVRC